MGYPKPLADGSLVVSRPKGIYKPRGWAHALSIRINLLSRYKDGEIRVRSDGSWFLAYHQEGNDLENPGREYTNRALFRCVEDQVPVGVLREIEVGPGSPVAYHIVGLAIPRKWHQGYFLLEGHTPPRLHDMNMPDHVARIESPPVAAFFSPDGSLDLGIDLRVKTLREIAARRGQPKFRRSLLEAYQGACAISRTRLRPILEAAHLRPYRGDHTDSPSNGLLLRADLHLLMDLRLLAVHPESRGVSVARILRGTEYESFDGVTIAEPLHEMARPSLGSLNYVWDQFLANV